jgi:hypothetical protein
MIGNTMARFYLVRLEDLVWSYLLVWYGDITKDDADISCEFLSGLQQKTLTENCFSEKMKRLVGKVIKGNAHCSLSG